MSLPPIVTTAKYKPPNVTTGICHNRQMSQPGFVITAKSRSREMSDRKLFNRHTSRPPNVTVSEKNTGEGQPAKCPTAKWVPRYGSTPPQSLQAKMNGSWTHYEPLSSFFRTVSWIIQIIILREHCSRYKWTFIGEIYQSCIMLIWVWFRVTPMEREKALQSTQSLSCAMLDICMHYFKICIQSKVTSTMFQYEIYYLSWILFV